MKTLRITSAMLAIMLLASGATPVVAMDAPAAAPVVVEAVPAAPVVEPVPAVPVAPAPEAAPAAPAAAAATSWTDSISGYFKSAGDKVKSAATTAYDYTLKPYSSYTVDEKTAIFAGLDATATKYKAPAPAQADQKASWFARLKEWTSTKYVDARKGMYNHPVKASIAYYTGLAAVTAGTGYGLYKLYQFIDAKRSPADLEVIKTIAAKYQDGQAGEAAFRKAIAQNKSVINGLKALAEVDAAALNHLLHALEEYCHELNAANGNEAYNALVKVVDVCVTKLKEATKAAKAA